MIDPALTIAEPLLRTLAPALRQLERKLGEWLAAPRHFPLGTMDQAALAGLHEDLRRQAEALDVDRPILIILLMGGTGVGKSTLLNALAGGAVAHASVARPTTRDPVVYYHESIKLDRLDPALLQCRLAAHDRPSLQQKILVDTPDLDSNDLSNREKLFHLLPIADIVLYVGSQEKYHDKLGWDLFLEQRRRRAFAFVLNKWDRCLHEGASGMRPDEDLLGDLRAQGFHDPLLFRTCAQRWLDQSNHQGHNQSASATNPVERGGTPRLLETQNQSASAETPSTPLPDGEQFQELANWLEAGLTRLEIEAIKARGVSQLLHQLIQTLERACPPDLTDNAGRTQRSWERLLGEEAHASAEILLNTLEPYQREIEHHFAVEGQRRFRGLMATYLQVFTRARYAGTSLRDHIPFLPKVAQKVQTPAAWDLPEFTRACSQAAGEQHLDARVKALANRLLVEANQQGFPVDLLTEATEETTLSQWRQRYAEILVDVLAEVERLWVKPTGPRRWIQGGIIWLANRLPLATLFAVLVLLLWQYTMQQRSVALGDILLPVIVVFIVLVILHLCISLVLPMRWRSMRGAIGRLLDRRLQKELEAVYASIPTDVAATLLGERRQIDHLIFQTREVAVWLGNREQAARISGLYGNEGQR